MPHVRRRFDSQRLLQKMDSRDQHRSQPASQRIRKDLHAPAMRSAAADFFVLANLMPEFIHHLMDALFGLFPIQLKPQGRG